MDEGGQATLSSSRVTSNKSCGAMSSGMGGRIEARSCTFSKNGTHGLACAGRAVLATRECTIKGNKQLGVLVQSGAHAEMSSDDVSRNGAHGLCLQLGGVLAASKVSVRNNKQSGLALMGVGSVGHVTGLNAVDNGIDGVHVGQGGSLKLSDSTVERSKRMGISAAGAETRAVITKCVVTDNGEYGIAQAGGAEVSCDECNVHSNTGGDVSGSVGLGAGNIPSAPSSGNNHDVAAASGGSRGGGGSAGGGGGAHGGVPHMANVRRMMDSKTPLMGSKLGRPRAGIRALVGVLFVSVFLLGYWADSLFWSSQPIPAKGSNPSKELGGSGYYMYDKPPPTYWAGNQQRWDTDEDADADGN
jgi:hypothetical protein